MESCPRVPKVQQRKDRLTDVGALDLLCSRNEKILKGATIWKSVFGVTLLNGIREIFRATLEGCTTKQCRMGFHIGSDGNLRAEDR